MVKKEFSQYAFLTMKYPLLFKLIILYVLFLPLRSIEIPGVFVGFSINPARLFAVLAVLVLFMNICLDGKCFNKIFNSGTYGNPFLNQLLILFIFSIFFYYITLVLGKTVLYGGQDFFFRSWKGRPIGQFISFVTYCVVPFYIIKKYAQDNSRRQIIERTIVIATIFLIYYGYIQQACFYLDLPITGRDLYEGRIAAEKIMGRVYLRFYSLGGEPRHFGGFIIGALIFYMYFHYGKSTLFSKINIYLMIVAFLLTLSTSSFIIAFFSMIAIMLDSIRYGRTKYGSKFLLIFLLILITLFSTGFMSIVADKTMRYYKAYSDYSSSEDSDMPRYFVKQSTNLATVFYLKNINDLNSLNLLFGFGYGNYSTGVYEILKNYFNRDIVERAKIASPSCYLFCLLIECGLLGILIYIMMILYTLKLSNKLIRCYKNINKIEYQRMLLLRYAFLVFAVSGALQISFYYFIVMGLIVGKLNSLTASKKLVWEIVSMDNNFDPLSDNKTDPPPRT